MISIIGGGPAGSYAGALLAKHQDVTIYEDHKIIGKPIQCTGIITGNLDEAIKVPKELVLNKLSRVRVYSKNEIVEFKLKRPNYVFDRCQFDQYIARLAEDNGVKFQYGRRFLEFNQNGKIKMKFNNGDIKETDILVGADGPLSNVAKSAGLFNNRKFVVGLQIRAKIECEEDVFETFLGEGEGYFGWLVPENNKIARIGIAASNNPRAHFNEILELKKGEFMEDQSGPIPLYNPDVITEKGNVFLIGDAATMVKATTYGGILPGLIAALEMEKAITKGLSYETLWRERMGKDLLYHLRIRKILDKFSDRDYDELLKMVKKEKVKETIETYDREYPSKMLFKLVFNEPKLLRFLWKLSPF